VQVAVEILVVSGLLTFSGQLLEAVESSALVEGIDRSTLSYVFWSAVCVLVLIPLFAIWRNCGAVAMILAEGMETGRLPQAFVERGIRAVFALALGYWLYLVVPQDAFSRWGWIIIALGAVAVVAVFSRRLIYWHSEWQTSVREVLADTRGDVGEVRAHARAALGESLTEWDLSLGDCTVPDGAAYVGQTLAELSIPSRFGCSVVEIDRNGHAITAPGAGITLFPGDRLLLLGQPAQVDAAREFLAADSRAKGMDAVEPAVLDTCTVPAARAGRSLADLRIATRTGVRVVGIHRGEQRILNPTGDQLLEERDALLLLGTLPRIRALRKWLAGDDTVNVPPAVPSRVKPAALGA
jgi:CPA2 family monovalent cation:H+ antiporter-2